MIFRQLYEPLSSTYTYLLGDERTGQAILIDPVISTMERDLAEVHRLGLRTCSLSCAQMMIRQDQERRNGKEPLSE